MICPQCKSGDMMTSRTHIKESVTMRGLFWRSEKKKKEKSVTHRCLDCGHMWEGQEESQKSSPAMGNISQYPAAVEEPEEEV